MKSLVTLSLLLGSLSACSSNDPETPGATAGTGAGGSAASTAGSNTGGGNGSAAGSGGDDLHGTLVISLAAPSEENEGHTSIIGRFFDGPTPNAQPLKLANEQGDCQLLVPDLPFCAEPCSPDVCTADDVCSPYPSPRSVGQLSVTGLAMPLTLDPATTMVVYQGPSLPNPPCVEGDEITASSASFELTANCITQLELTGPDPIPVMAGQAVNVSWLPPEDPEGSRIRIGLDISHHGGKKGEIACDVPDTGELVIPESLVTQLVELGLAGYPTINVNRVSVGQAGSNVSLIVSSDVTRPVDTGVMSCQEDSECPDGQICKPVGICG